MAADATAGLLARLCGGRAVLGQTQFLPGYSLLLNEQHQADRLTDRPRAARLAFLDSMEMLGEAVEIVCRRHDASFRRINLEIISCQPPCPCLAALRVGARLAQEAPGRPYPIVLRGWIWVALEWFRCYKPILGCVGVAIQHAGSSLSRCGPPKSCFAHVWLRPPVLR
jgi:hypothetical protein